MKKILMTAAVAITAITGAFAQPNTSATDVQHATLNTSVPFMIALRPYTTYTTASDNQSLTANVTNATDVLNTNHFDYNGNSGYNGLAYKIFSNYTYRVVLQSVATGSNDELNDYINYHAETLPSPQNGIAPYTSNGNQDHVIEVPNDTRLYTTEGSGTEILANNLWTTGRFPGPFTDLSAAAVQAADWAAFGIKFYVAPGFSIVPGNYVTTLTITATTP